MPIITPLLDETLTYPNLTKTISNLTSPAVAIKITRIAYRPGYLPNPEADRVSISQIITVGNDPLIADSQESWIVEGLQLITFPINEPYSLRLEFPAWYQEIELIVSLVGGLTLPSGSSGMTSQAGLNAAIAQINASLAQKAPITALDGLVTSEGLAAALANYVTGTDLAAALAAALANYVTGTALAAALVDYVDTAELLAALSLKADSNHNHDDLYYLKSETYNRPEIDALIASGAPAPTFTYQSDGDTNGLFYWLGTNEGNAAWSNPHDLGKIQVSASSTPFPLGSFVNRQLGNIYVNNFPEPVFLQFDLKTIKLKPSGYIVRARADEFSRPQNFGLYGSNSPDGGWVLLDFQDVAIANSAWRYRAVSTSTSYRYFRLQQDGLNQGGEKYLTLCWADLYGTVDPVI